MSIPDSFSDFTESKTTNINLRVTPGLKAQLISQGARIGMHLSDYINLLIQQSAQQNRQLQQLSETAENLRRELKDAQTALQQMESVLNPLFAKTESQVVSLGREKVEIKTRLDLLHLLVKCFKINER